MSPNERVITIRLDQALMERLEQNKERFGTPVSEQVRRAVVAWLDAGGVLGGQEPPVKRRRPKQ